jgi:hypothetical protein
MSPKNRTPRRSSVIDADTGSGAGQVLPHTRTTRAVRQTKPLMAWTPRPNLYGTPAKICLPGQAPAISKKRPYLAGLAKHRESGLAVVDKTEDANRGGVRRGDAGPLT